MKLWIVAAAYGLWLFGIEAVFYLVGGSDENALQFAVVAGIVPVLAQLLVLGFNPLGLAAPTKYSIVLVLVVLLSFLGHAYSWTPLIYVCDISFLLGIAIIFAGSPDQRLLRSTAVIASVSIGILLVYVNFAGEYVLGRLSANGIQPNFWGTTGLAVALAAVAAKRLPIVIFGLGSGLLTIYDASARGSLVGLLAAMLALMIASALRLRSYRLVAAIAVAGGIPLVIMLVPSYLAAIGDVISTDVFKVNDPYRGLGSGFTGRSDLWAEAINTWMRSPLFGVGYHQSDRFITDQLGAHSAYLSTLADMGVAGLLLYCGLLIWSFVAALSIRDARTCRVTIALVVGYAVYGLFESRAFNLGNPFSLLFLMVGFYALADQQRRRAALQLRSIAPSNPISAPIPAPTPAARPPHG